MKIIFYLCSVLNLINALTLNLKLLNNSEILILNNTINEITMLNYNKTSLQSSFFVQNETCHRDPIKNFEISCVKFDLESSNLEMLSFRSLCDKFSSSCPHYTTDMGHGSLAPRNICPLKGTLQKASVFIANHVDIEQISKQITIRKIFALVDGCYYINEYGTKVEASWIITEGFLGDRNLPFLYLHLYDQIVTDIYFDDFNRDCSKLCETHCSKLYETHCSTTIKNYIQEILYSIRTCIHGVLIFFAIIGCILFIIDFLL